jgi:hypothetical protein
MNDNPYLGKENKFKLFDKLKWFVLFDEVDKIIVIMDSHKKINILPINFNLTKKEKSLILLKEKIIYYSHIVINKIIFTSTLIIIVHFYFLLYPLIL